MLRFLTGGESHGKCLVAILEGMVAGLRLKEEDINIELVRRQGGYGRGGRMSIEKDRVQIVSGVRADRTLGGPITLVIENKDFKINELPVVKRPRPGHADLVGAIKYGHVDVRDTLERASARETAARVAVGSVCRTFLKSFDIEILSHVVMIGGVEAKAQSLSFESLRQLADKSPVRCADPHASLKMIKKIDQAKKQKDTVGGVFEVIIRGAPVGLGSFAQYDRRLNSLLGASLLSIQAVKGVEVGMGFEVARTWGSETHDEIFYDKHKGFYRKTNRAGGIEGGISNGEPIVLRAATKPYSTLMRPLKSVNIDSKKQEEATVERSDITAVPACGVVGEAMAAFVIAKVFLEKFGGDGMEEVKRNYEQYLKQIKRF